MKDNKRGGVYLGVVEYNKDPQHWGRVQVRVDEIYGTKEDTPSNLLPWARIVQFGGGFYDGGSHWMPPVGSTVLVVFEHGDTHNPYVIGTVPKKPTDNNVYGNSEESMGEWTPGSTDTDVPKEVKADGEESTYVVYKTPKGAALIISEKDGEEYLRLIDRSGAMLEMVSNVSAADNQGNASQRGDAVAPSGIGKSKVQSGLIKIIDLEGQHITIDMTNKKISLESKGDMEETIGGDKTKNITGDKTDQVQGKWCIDTGGDVEILSASKIRLNAPQAIIECTTANIGNGAQRGVARLGDTVKVAGVDGVITSASAVVSVGGT